MSYFALSLVALAAAPFLYLLVEKFGHAFFYVEAFIYFAIAGLVVLHIVPESFVVCGWWAILAIFVGWFAPTAVEYFSNRFVERIHMVPLLLSVVGLCLHGMLDGLALAHGGHRLVFDHEGLHYHALPTAVVLHRIPASLLLWWSIRPKYGISSAVIVLICLGGFTTFGFFFGSEVLWKLHQEFYFGLFQALVGGSLLHLASHRVVH